MLASTQQPLDLRAPRLYFKEFIKENLIDDVLPNDQPDPWYASQHIMIQTHQLPRRKASEYHAVTCQLPTASRKSSGSARIKSSKARQQAPKTLNLSELSAKMPSSSNRKRPHSTESIIKWMDERLARQQEKSIRMRSQSSPTTESPKFPSVPATPRAPARPHVQRVVKAEPECALKRAHKILSHIPETCIEITPPNRSARRGSSSSLGHKKPNRLDADEWPHILSQGTDEQDRLVAQHYVLRTAFQGDYCVPLRSALQAGAVVLDIGCGSGTWAMEMATEFAASAFIGIDRNRHYPMDIKPKNCFFRSYDISHLPLPFPDNSVDYIFQRDLNWDMLSQAWDPLMAEYMRILKPGGWIELVEPVSNDRRRLWHIGTWIMTYWRIVSGCIGYENSKQSYTRKCYER